MALPKKKSGESREAYRRRMTTEGYSSAQINIALQDQSWASPSYSTYSDSSSSSCSSDSGSSSSSSDCGGGGF